MSLIMFCLESSARGCEALEPRLPRGEAVSEGQEEQQLQQQVTRGRRHVTVGLTMQESAVRVTALAHAPHVTQQPLQRHTQLVAQVR